MKAVKKLGRSYTITHVVHAAMIVTVLKRSSATNKNDGPQQPIVSSCFINGRKYLTPDKPEAQRYLPICQATGIIDFPHVLDYTYVARDDQEEKIEAQAKEALLKACKAANESYQKIRERPSILSESLQRAQSTLKWVDQF